MPKLSVASQPYEVTFSRNPVKFRFKVSPFADEDAAVNTVISATLYCEDGHYRNKFVALKQVQLRPDQDGFAVWDVATLLDAQLSFYVPKIGDTGLQACSTQGARYYMRYSLTNDYEQLQAPAETDMLNVIKGGLAYESLYTRQFFEDKIKTAHEPLRFGYTGESAGPDEPLYLFFLDPFGFDSSYKLQAFLSIRKQPGGALPSVTRETATGATGGKWQVWCLAIGYTQQNLASMLSPGQVADTIYSEVFTTGLTGGASPRLTKLVDIRLDYRNHYKTRTLHYHNSLGGLDTQVTRGQIELSGSYDKQNVTLLDTDAFAEGRVLKAINRTEDARETSSLKGETGWIPEARADRLRDLLRSNNAWEIVAGRLKPVQLVNKSARILANNDKLISLGLDWQGTYADANYTPDDFLAQGSFCPGVDFLEATQEKVRMPHIAWRIPEGYELIEIRWSTSNAVPATTTNNTIVLGGSRGESDIDTTALYPMTSGATPWTNFTDVYFFARVICDNNVSTFSAGAWKTIGPFRLYAWPPPLARSDFFTTYRGAGSRVLGYPLVNDKMRQNGTPQLALVTGPGPTTGTSCTGSAGGTFTWNSTTKQLSYTPPSAGFAGNDICEYQLKELTAVLAGPVFVVSPPVYGKIYVTVGDAGASSLTFTGMPYLKLEGWGGGRLVSNGSGAPSVETQHLQVYFYKDPLGQIPFDITGLSLTVPLAISSIKGGATTTYVNQSFTFTTGTSKEIINTNTSLGTFDGNWRLRTDTSGDYVYKLLPGTGYLLL